MAFFGTTQFGLSQLCMGNLTALAKRVWCDCPAAEDDLERFESYEADREQENLTSTDGSQIMLSC